MLAVYKVKSKVVGDESSGLSTYKEHKRLQQKD